ncbi:MAG: caspase family protein [Bacteroidales bacterium]|nr:caspase family protein [Bacteroidales bacterium]
MKLKVLSLLALLLTCFTLQARVYVLSVGVSNYYGKENNLPQASRAAKEFAETMKLQTQDVTLLTSKYATVANIREKLNAIVSKAAKDDRIVFFHEGHGYDGGFCGVDGTISYKELAQTLAKSPANLKLVFLGGCHSGSAKNEGILNYGDQAWITATRADELGAEAGGSPYYFGGSVVKGLRGKADFNADKDVTLTELFKYVYNDITNKSSKAVYYDAKGNPEKHYQHPTLIAPKALHDRVIIRHK